jgi:hypothetical protein
VPRGWWGAGNTVGAAAVPGTPAARPCSTTRRHDPPDNTTRHHAHTRPSRRSRGLCAAGGQGGARRAGGVH